jgi:hypothetical protein
LGPNAQAQLFSRLEDYRFHLLNRLGQLKETFPAKIVKGLAFTPLTNIRDFVHNYLLDENLVDVKTLREQLETDRRVRPGTSYPTPAASDQWLYPPPGLQRRIFGRGQEVSPGIGPEKG